MKMSSQDSTTLPMTASSGQKTPPITALVASTLPPEIVKEKKIGHRRVDEQTGEVTYKKVGHSLPVNVFISNTEHLV